MDDVNAKSTDATNDGEEDNVGVGDGDADSVDTVVGSSPDILSSNKQGQGS